MSSLTGIAQFTNQFAKNIMGYDQDKKDEAERVADKQYNRNRQQQADLREQQNHDVTLQGNQIKLDETKDARTDSVNARNYGKTFNQVEYFKNLGDKNGAINAIVEGANSHSDLPYKISVDRDVKGNIAARTDENGNEYYFQNIIDKETGKVIRTDSVTYDQLYNGYKQLQNGQSLAAEKTAYEAERRKALDENSDRLSLRLGEAKIDDAKDADKAQRDYGYTVSLEGIKFGNQTQRDETLHGYAIDKQNNQAGHAQSLAYIQGELAAGRIDQQTYNRMEEYLYKAGVDQGQTPGVTLGKDRASQVNGIISSLTGTESSGNSGAFRTNSNGKSYGGLIQMGDDRLKDYASATGSRPISAGQFKNLPAAQQRAVNEWHINDLISAAQATGAVGKVINGVPVTLGGLVAVAHLGGKGGMNKFVQTDGRYNPKDQLGTSLTDYLVKHRSSTVGGVQTTLTQPLAAKTPKGASKTNQTPAQTVRTTKDYNATVDKGVNIALKDVKNLGIKPDAATTATYARAGTKLKSMGAAKNEQEFLNLYQEAFDLVIGAVPDRASKKMSKADKNALGHKVLLSMAGASSLGQLKQMIYNINPRARGGGKAAVSAGGLTLNLPGQQVTSSKPASQFQAVRNRKQQEAADAFNGKSATIPTGATPQTGKLQSLYARGLPAVKTDPKTAENVNYLENLNDHIEW